MKRRVRGLLHRKWLESLCAMILVGLPVVVTLALVFFFVRPAGLEAPSIFAQVKELFAQTDVLTAVMMLSYTFEFDFSWLISILPSVVIFVGVLLFVSMPMSVSLSGYFLSFLRGKKPKCPEVFDCFSGRYPRALGGMLYMLLWMLLWTFSAFVAPFLLFTLGSSLIAAFAEALSGHQIVAFIVLIVACVVWFVSFFLLFFNRILAYSFTAVCIAGQPRLPAYRAVRLSRKLMRGCKWQLIGLRLSFLNYYLPAILAGVLLATMHFAGSVLGLSEGLMQSARLFLWIVVGANQLVIVYIAPYMSACFRAFYIERKREALMDEEVTSDDFAPKQRADYRVQKERKDEHVES